MNEICFYDFIVFCVAEAMEVNTEVYYISAWRYGTILRCNGNKYYLACCVVRSSGGSREIYKIYEGERTNCSVFLPSGTCDRRSVARQDSIDLPPTES